MLQIHLGYIKIMVELLYELVQVEEAAMLFFGE
jgi:hypothetical protein